MSFFFLKKKYFVARPRQIEIATVSERKITLITEHRKVGNLLEPGYPVPITCCAPADLKCGPTPGEATREKDRRPNDLSLDPRRAPIPLD